MITLLTMGCRQPNNPNNRQTWPHIEKRQGFKLNYSTAEKFPLHGRRIFTGSGQIMVGGTTPMPFRMRFHQQFGYVSFTKDKKRMAKHIWWKNLQNCLLLGAAEATRDSAEKDRSCSGRHAWFKQEGNLLCSCSLPLLSWKILSFKMTTRQNIGKTAPTYLHRETLAISEGCLCASLFECPRSDWKKWWGRGGGEGWCAVVFIASSWSSFELFMSWNGSVFHWWAAFASCISSFCKHAWRCSWNRRSSLLFL